MRLRVLHTTRYLYPTPASDSHNEARLMPLSDVDQTCLDFRLTRRLLRAFSLTICARGACIISTCRAPHRELNIRAEALVVTHQRQPVRAICSLMADDWIFTPGPTCGSAIMSIFSQPRRVPLAPETDRIAAVARKQAGVGTASFLIALTRLLHRAFTFAPGSTTIHTSLRKFWKTSRACARTLRI